MSASPVGRVQGRAAFEQFRRPDGRAERGPLRMIFVEPGGTGPVPRPGVEPAARVAVAYAVGRRCGNAVVRNRLRRRLREAVRLRLAEIPSGKYLLLASPRACDLGFSELVTVVTAGLQAAASPRSMRVPSQ